MSYKSSDHLEQVETQDCNDTVLRFYIPELFRPIFQTLRENKLDKDFHKYYKAVLLEDINAHERDSRIRFYHLYELPDGTKLEHVYIIDGEIGKYKSTTTYIHTFFAAFDAVAVIKNMMAKPNWPQSKYYGMSSEEIQLLWSSNNANELGSRMHDQLETYFNGIPVEDWFISTPEWKYFQNYLDDTATLIPYRTEWFIFDELYLISGAIDMVYVDPEKPDHLIIADWKRSKEISDKYYRKGKHPFRHMWDSTLSHYSLQVNVYKWILEALYNVKVSKMFLVRIHPDSPNYERIDIPVMTEEIDAMMKVRLEQLQADFNRS